MENEQNQNSQGFQTRNNGEEQKRDFPGQGQQEQQSGNSKNYRDQDAELNDPDLGDESLDDQQSLNDPQI